MDGPELQQPRTHYQSPRTLAKWVTGAFAVYIAADVYSVWLALDGLGLIDEIEAGNHVSDEKLLAFEQNTEKAAAAILGGIAVCAIAWCMWVHRVAKNTQSFGVPLLTSPGMAVGYYFIPIVNLWKPYTALTDVWRGSDPTLEDPHMAMGSRVPWFFLTWWLTWLGSGFIDRWAQVKLENAETNEAIASGFHVMIWSIGVDLVAVALALTVLWRLTRRQEERAHAGMPAARVVSTP